jgi:hypothetical protein
MVVRVAFADPVDPAGLNRREVAAETHARVATLLGLTPEPDSAPGTGAGR